MKKQGSGEVKKHRNEKIRCNWKGGGVVSGGGHGSPAGTNHAREKHLLPGTGDGRVARGSGMGIARKGDISSGIPNPNDPKWQQFFLAYRKLFFLKWLLRRKPW